MRNFTTLVACFISLTSIIAQISETEKLALEDIYHSTNGSQWHNSWDLTTPVTTWYGVEIKNDAVVGLDLGFNNLKGNLPSSIGDLKNIQYIKIYFNQLDGEIPSSIGNLKSLEILDFTNNFLTGHIPSSLGNLTFIKEMLLSSNSLLGSIPESFGNLNTMQTLSVFDNNLTGHIPASLAQLKQLDNLMIAANDFDSTAPFSEAIKSKYSSELIFENVNPQELNIIATSLLDDDE